MPKNFILDMMKTEVHRGGNADEEERGGSARLERSADSLNQLMQSENRTKQLERVPSY